MTCAVGPLPAFGVAFGLMLGAIFLARDEPGSPEPSSPIVSLRRPTTAVLVAFLWELAHGRDASPYALLGGIAGAAFIGATV